MKILIINSSFRKDGNTQRLLESIKEEFSLIAEKHSVNVEFENVYLAHEKIDLCRGCRLCFDKGEEKCPLKDDTLNIKEKIINSDGIILASPVYVEDVNGIMKNWIDRMAFNCHRPSLCGKPTIIITTSGSFSSNHTVQTMNTAFNAWGGVTVGKGKFRTGALTSKDEIKTRNTIKIRKLAEKLFKTLNVKKSEYPSLYSLVAFKVQQKYWQKSKKTGTYDYIYWKEKGWLKNSCNYYAQHNAGWFKTSMARLFGNFVSLFFL